jgi:hypothetical protein
MTLFGGFKFLDFVSFLLYNSNIEAHNIREFMTKALTQEEFIKKAKMVHGDAYSYDKTNYIRSNLKIIVTCPKEGHGDWEVTPNNHLKRKCPKCACTFTNAKEAFLPKASAQFGDLYDYSEVVYTRSTEKVKIKCHEHGFFYVTPSNHLNGFGCAKCSYERMAKKKTKSLEEYITEVQAVHGDRYGLDKISYSHCFDKVTIICHEHGEFSALANSFLQGHGCPSCMEGGFNQMKAGSLYVMTDGDICKIGITNQSAAIRAEHINKMSKLSFSSVFEKRFEDGSVPLNIETILLRELRAKYKSIEMKFNGSSECFYCVDISALLSRIEELIKELNAHY